MLVKFICSAHLSFLYAFFFFNKPGLFKTDFEQAQKPSLCKVVYQLWQDELSRLLFSRDFTDIKSGESSDTE